MYIDKISWTDELFLSVFSDLSISDKTDLPQNSEHVREKNLTVKKNSKEIVFYLKKTYYMINKPILNMLTNIIQFYVSEYQLIFIPHPSLITLSFFIIKNTALLAQTGLVCISMVI